MIVKGPPGLERNEREVHEHRDGGDQDPQPARPRRSRKDTETGRETDYATDQVYPSPGTGAGSGPVVRALDVGGGSLDDASEAPQPPEISTDDEQRRSCRNDQIWPVAGSLLPSTRRGLEVRWWRLVRHDGAGEGDFRWGARVDRVGAG
jgi:hypothetical protein